LDNPYQHTLQTRVAAVDGNKVLFDATIAYSFAGGQESDKAVVNGIPILDSKWKVILFIIPYRITMVYKS